MAITKSIQTNVQTMKDEMREVHKERDAHLHLAFVGLIAQLHTLYIAKGGTGKSMMIRDLTGRIVGTEDDPFRYFEMAGDESTDPGEAVGPVNILAIRDRGVQERVLEGYLCTADVAFLDEFFNLNGVTRHKLMPILNERVFHNGGQVVRVPLKATYMATNILDIANNQAALWDRVHLRMPMEYVQERQHKTDLVHEAMLRKQIALLKGAGIKVDEPTRTTITKAELEQATIEAYGLIEAIPEKVDDVFQDIHEELFGDAGIEVSTRRMTDGMAAVLGNAWVNGHEEVTVGDLDILQHCWWITDGDIDNVRNIVLSATNPGEKAALDKLDDLDKLKKELSDAVSADIDQMRKNSVGIDVYRNCERLREEAEDLRQTALAAGAGTTRVDELIEKTGLLQAEVGKQLFGIKGGDLSALAGV